jgi:mono/diheme cytochrome c family protein
MKKSLLILVPLLALVACDGEPIKESKTFVGGKTVSAATLNLGRTTYLEYCVQCHGYEGKGDGPSSKGLIPPPRNLTQGLYKFANVPYGEVPHDDDFYRIIRGGLKGSAMLPWDISDERLDAVTQYIKTFAPEFWADGEGKALGTKFEITPDPFGADKKAEAIALGKKVYHLTAQCTTCHRGYETKADIVEMSKTTDSPLKLADLPADLYQLKNQDGEYNYKVTPPDFTYHELRSITDLNSIVQRLAYGVTGSGMPGWKDVVTDDELWAAAYYVQSLIDVKNNPEARKELLNKLDNQK